MSKRNRPVAHRGASSSRRGPRPGAVPHPRAVPAPAPRPAWRRRLPMGLAVLASVAVIAGAAWVAASGSAEQPDASAAAQSAAAQSSPGAVPPGQVEQVTDPALVDNLGNIARGLAQYTTEQLAWHRTTLNQPDFTPEQAIREVIGGEGVNGQVPLFLDVASDGSAFATFILTPAPDPNGPRPDPDVEPPPPVGPTSGVLACFDPASQAWVGAPASPGMSLASCPQVLASPPPSPVAGPQGPGSSAGLPPGAATSTVTIPPASAPAE